jgi:hypothetical protein
MMIIESALERFSPPNVNRYIGTRAISFGKNIYPGFIFTFFAYCVCRDCLFGDGFSRKIRRFIIACHVFKCWLSFKCRAEKRRILTGNRISHNSYILAIGDQLLIVGELEGFADMFKALFNAA